MIVNFKDKKFILCPTRSWYDIYFSYTFEWSIIKWEKLWFYFKSPLFFCFVRKFNLTKFKTIELMFEFINKIKVWQNTKI